MLLVSFDSAAGTGYRSDRRLRSSKQGVKGMRPGGGTSLYDAIYFASKEKLMMDQPRDKFRRAMIVISDGEDTASRCHAIRRSKWPRKPTS